MGPGPIYSRPQAVSAMVDQTVRKGTLLVPERCVSGASGVPTPAATPRETTNPEGADGQNTTLFECAKRGLTPYGAALKGGDRCGPEGRVVGTRAVALVARAA
jgi:hypothetical protein